MLDRILAPGVIAVVRSERPGPLVEVARALARGGVTAIEITFTVPGAVGVIERVARELDDEIQIGAGTVLDAETARAAILAGAQFVVSPSTDPRTIELCRRYSVPVMPGALTPTEVVTAWQAGADVVKIFPSELTGPRYLKALRGPLPQIRLLPTGGISLENAREFLECGAAALGVGSALVSPQHVASEDFDEIERRARQFVRIVREYRGA